MKKEDVIIGMKVVPHDKTAKNWEGLENSDIWKDALQNNQPYLFVAGFDTYEEFYELSKNSDEDGDFFNPEDFEPYLMKNGNELIIDIVKCAKEIFCNGLYVPSTAHPCGWDFISFESIDLEDDVLEYTIESSDICDGAYSWHDYEGLTIKELLEKTKGKYAFEIGSMDW